MNIIEQADKIVFGDERTKDRLHNAMHPNGLAVDTLRRGAYIEWLMVKNHDEAIKGLFDDIGLMAERIVSIDAATRPKGDGLPEMESWSHGPRGFAFNTIANEIENARLGQLIFDCFRSPNSPVRRLLAEYEVHDDAPPKGVMTRVCQHRGDPIYLVPKAVKP